MAMGWDTWISTTSGQLIRGNGTSFATPVMAGAVACYMVAHQSFSSLKILDTLRHTASNHLAPNNSQGWGRPNLCAIPVGLFEQKADNAEFTVFPNPFNNMIVINLNKVSYKINSVQLVDLLGNVVRSETPKNAESKIDFNTGELSAGVYFIKLNTASGIMTKKIIKQ